jgi:hypothetical protein
MSDARSAQGIMLLAGDGASPEIFTAVGELVSLKPPALSRNEIDVTAHNVPRDAKILGIFRQGQVSGMINYVPTDPTHQLMLSDLNANTKRNWRITYPPDAVEHDTFPARVQLFEVQDAPVDAALQAAFALTIDGEIVSVP